MSSTDLINAATTSLKDTPIVVKEGNDVSGQVVKPIYPEELDKNSPLMSNLSVASSCRTVRARYTVNAVEDISLVELFPTSLASYDPHTISPTNNIAQLISTTTSEDEDEQLFISSILNCQLEPDLPHLETITQITENLGTIDPTTCYNKFLFYYKLPPLEHPQTIFTLLKYLRDDFSLYYSPSYIRISILNKKDTNDYYEEAHIYLPNKPYPLPNHFTPPFQDLLRWFRYTPLKTSSPSLYDSTHYPLNLSICTHNIRGFNQKSKQQGWEDYCLANNLDIISLTETKLAYSSFYSKLLATPSYTYFWSCTDSSKAGTAIMICKHLTPHIHKITTHPE